MLIKVCTSEQGAQPLEWALIELQGYIEYADEELAQSMRDIGMLRVTDQAAGTVQLTIGYHQLEGKRVPLKKPYAIIEKQDSTGGDDTEQEKDIHYEVKGVIRDKYLFKTRPTALISKPLGRK